MFLSRIFAGIIMRIASRNHRVIATSNGYRSADIIECMNPQKAWVIFRVAILYMEYRNPTISLSIALIIENPMYA